MLEMFSIVMNLLKYDLRRKQMGTNSITAYVGTSQAS